MDFWRTVLVLVRRWYITVPAFFVTLGMAGAAYSVVPVQYQSVSVLVLTTPLSGGTETAHSTTPNSLTNPLLNFDQSLALTASIVIQEMNSLETAKNLGVTPGGSVTYQVTNGSTNPELPRVGTVLVRAGNRLERRPGARHHPEGLRDGCPDPRRGPARGERSRLHPYRRAGRRPGNGGPTLDRQSDADGGSRVCLRESREPGRRLRLREHGDPSSASPRGDGGWQRGGARPRSRPSGRREDG